MTRSAPLAAWFGWPDRVELDRCGICDAAACAPCNPDEPSFCHVGRRWDIGLTHPGERLDVDAGTYPTRSPQCAPTVEVNDRYDFERPDSFGGFERIAMLYRGACLGCGWAGEPVEDENVAVENAHDHALPDWRRLPTSGRFPYADGAAGRRRCALLIAEINEHRRALGFGAGYLLGAGAPLLTLRDAIGTRSHWDTAFDGYDICAGRVGSPPPAARAAQLSLFGDGT